MGVSKERLERAGMGLKVRESHPEPFRDPLERQGWLQAGILSRQMNASGSGSKGFCKKSQDPRNPWSPFLSLKGLQGFGKGLEGREAGNGIPSGKGEIGTEFPSGPEFRRIHGSVQGMVGARWDGIEGP
ncbi:hypothetical protein DUI87_00021 [Hirundo rustica rustica]|uniref:Uncharacterized protein n=1 Tax=Hirundo rustica rustica TaxID=333673 RepID=A0A3M0LD49_HIRRU|nr:hypothetical protein DUI87_00021 [Hirundo rustica rustica]